MIQVFLRVNFIFVTWFIVVFLIYSAFSTFSIPYDEFQNRYGSFRSTNRYLAPLLLLGIHLLMVYVAVKKDDGVKKIISFFYALAVLVATVIIPLLRYDAYGKGLDSAVVYGGLYASISYLAYALFYRGSSTTIIIIR